MKIGISTSVIQSGKTGIAKYLFGLVDALLRAGPEHELVLFVLEDDLPLFSFLNGNVRIVPVAESHRSPARDILWHQQTLPTLARDLRLDVLHVPSYRRMLWPKPCPLVATVHDLAAFHVPEKYDRKRMFYGRVVARQLAYRQDAIIAISHTTAKDIERFWKLGRDRVTVIHNGLDHDQFAPLPPTSSQGQDQRPFGLTQPFFLYVARLEHPAKNHVRLIKAFEAFRKESGLPWQLVLAGGDWHGASAIHETIRHSPCSSEIRCLGFVPDAALPRLYRAAAVFVYPSLYEGFGFPPLEAMACGCPVICSDRGALTEVVDHAALVVNPEDVTRLKTEMVRLAGEGAVRQQLRAAGLERAAQFHWSHAAEQTLEVYQRVIHQGRKSEQPMELAAQLISS